MLLYPCDGFHKRVFTMISRLLLQKCLINLSFLSLITCAAGGDYHIVALLLNVPSRIYSKQHEASKCHLAYSQVSLSDSKLVSRKVRQI